MIALKDLEREIMARGKVDGPELAMLHQYMYVNGKPDRPKADRLVELHKRVEHMTPAFDQFFYQAIKDHILADGRIDAEKSAWLRRMLFADAAIDDQERKLLHELKGEAKHVSMEFETLFRESMKQPSEPHTC